MNTPKSIQKATKKSLAKHGANFSMNGLKHHFAKLNRYTNPSGGGLDKIPFNTKISTASYYDYWQDYEPSATPISGGKPHLRKKAQYQVADHLLGIGKKAYWTGSTGKFTLLGLDIDDHGTSDPQLVQQNSQASLQLFSDLTGLKPFPCESPGGINAFLLLDKQRLTTEATNRTWQAIVRVVESERRQRGMIANLECKGLARIFDSKTDTAYCGVLLKDPFFAQNPTDNRLQEFWKHLESNALNGKQLVDLLQRLENDFYIPLASATPQHAKVAATGGHSDLIKKYRGNWAKTCREWAINGLPCDDSIAIVVSELALWLYFVELWGVPEDFRLNVVSDHLWEYCSLKNNGFITRLNKGDNDAVNSHVFRICVSAIGRATEKAKTIFSEIRSKQLSGQYVDSWQLLPLMKQDKESALSSSSLYSSSSSVRFTQCCSDSGEEKEWLPNPEYWREKAKSWKYVPDDTPLPAALNGQITCFYKKRGIRVKRGTKTKILRFLNHIWANSGEARLGIEALKKMGFTNHASRQHIDHLLAMGVIRELGYCPVAGLSKGFRLLEAAHKLFEAQRGVIHEYKEVQPT